MRQKHKHKGIRIALVVIEAIIGLGALAGGVAILTNAFGQWLAVEWLQGTPFSDYTVPGLLLLIVVGGGMLLAAITAFIQSEWAVLLSAAMGVVMVGFEVVEASIIDRYAQAIVPSTIVQQVLMAGLGLTVFGLVSYLWINEYRSHHFPTRHISHA